MKPPALYGIWDDQAHRLVQGGFWGVDGEVTAGRLVELARRGDNPHVDPDDAADWEVIPVCFTHHDQPADDCWDCADGAQRENGEKR